MKLEEAASAGNKAFVGLCEAVLEDTGPGPTYECVVGSIATTALVHAFRMGIDRSPEKAAEILQSILNDVALNVFNLNSLEIKFTVQMKLGAK